MDKIEQMRQEIYNILVKLGLKCSLTGFIYAAYGAELVAQNPALIHNLCNGLYLQIADKFGVKNPQCVERNIRHSLDLAHKNGGLKNLNKILGATIVSSDKKPNAGEFLTIVAKIYELGLCQSRKNS